MRWLEHPRARAVVILLALALALPSLLLPFYADDFAINGFLEKRFFYDPPWWDLYNFFPRDPATAAAMVHAGEVPWWAAPDLRLHFVRPLPSALLALDHAVFHHAALGWHVHSLLWYVGLLLLAGALFRRLLSPASANLALLAYAVAGANVFPFAWPSARTGLVCALFGALGIALHVRARAGESGPQSTAGSGSAPETARSRATIWLSRLAFVGALLGGEGGLGAIAFALAYDLVGPRRGPWRSRLVRAAPLLLMAAAYLGVYAAIGGGAHGSAAYLSPLSEPLAFARAAVVRIPTLLANATLGVPAELAILGLGGGLAIAGVLGTTLVAWLWWASAPMIPREEREHGPWLALGTVLAIAGAAGGMPGARELIVADLGGAALLALLLRYGLGCGPKATVRRIGIGLLALVHLVAGPLTQLANERSMGQTAERTAATARDLAREANVDPVAFIVAGSDPMTSMYAPTVAAVSGIAPPTLHCVAWIAGVPGDMTIVRTSYVSMTIAPRTGAFLRGAFETLFRAPDEAMQVDDQVSVCGSRVRVTAVDNGRPTQIEVTRLRGLEQSGAAWLAWKAGGLERLALPPIGQALSVGWTPGPSGLF